MSDENISDPTTGNALDSPPEPVDAAPSVTADAGENGAPDLSQTTAPSITTDTKKLTTPIVQSTPSASIDTGRYEECRSESRIHVRWHAEAFIDEQGPHHGFVKDISLKGADIFIDHNLQNVKLIKLHIHVPPLSVTSDRHIVEVTGKVIYAAHDSSELVFRAGIKFLKFDLESERVYLQSRI